MTLKVAIAGYGNLGKSLEKAILQDNNLQLVAVFSRRKSQPNHFAFEDAPKFSGQIDCLFAAMGSQSDIEQSIAFFKDFNTVDSFDTHAKIAQYRNRLESLKPNTVSLCCVGWDPGLLSCLRGLLGLCGNVQTFWGRGISQGHSNALRAIEGVEDAVQITAPIARARRRVKKCPQHLHRRICFVAAPKKSRKEIAQNIRKMPHYFAGQKVKVVFCTKKRVAKIKHNTRHAGEVLAWGNGCSARAKLDIACNTDFTAKIMIEYAKILPQLQQDGYCGALTPYDIPLKYLAKDSLL